MITSLPGKVQLYGYNYKIKNNGEVGGKNPADIEAEDIIEQPEKYYGKYVTNYNSPNDEGISDDPSWQLGKWQVFLADDSNIYLIASNHISRYYTKEKNRIRILL